MLQCVFLKFVDQRACRLAVVGIESQIERGVSQQAEPPPFIGQLIGREPEVRQHSIDRGHFEPGKLCGKVDIAGGQQVNGEAGQGLCGQRNHHRVAIESNEPAAGDDLLNNVPAVPTCTDGRIHNGEARVQLQMLQDLLSQDGDVNRGGCPMGAGHGDWMPCRAS